MQTTDYLNCVVSENGRFFETYTLCLKTSWEQLLYSVLPLSLILLENIIFSAKISHFIQREERR
jgi:hypothetical protein